MFHFFITTTKSNNNNNNNNNCRESKAFNYKLYFLKNNKNFNYNLT